MKKILLFLTALLLTACFENNNKTQNSTEKTNTTQNGLLAIAVKEKSIANQSQCVQVKEKDVDGQEQDKKRCADLLLVGLETNFDWLTKALNEELMGEFMDSENSTQLSQQAVQTWFDAALAELKQEGMGFSIFRQLDFIAQRYRIATFVLFSDVYSGGAHGVYKSRYLHFDLVTQKPIELTDILIDSSKLEELEGLLSEANMNRLAPQTQNHEDYRNPHVTDNFVFSEKGLRFIYGVYELGGFAEGEIALDVDYWDLEGILKPEFMFLKTRLNNLY